MSTVQEPAPALAALLLDQMHAYKGWDLRPALYFVYEDNFSEVRIPAELWDKAHPRAVIRHIAMIFEDQKVRDRFKIPTPPRSLVGVALMYESWGLDVPPEEMAELDRKGVYFGNDPRAYEMRQLIVYQPGRSPVVAQHERDSKGNGATLRFPRPGIQTKVFLPGTAVPSIHGNLQRIMKAVTAPPATFLAKGRLR